MPNHVHLLLECSGSPLGKFMQGLQLRIPTKIDTDFAGKSPRVPIEVGTPV